MGLFGAMTTAVGGLRAQAFALENISGNIANSQTTGFKRVDTSFADMVPDSIPQLQLAGGVLARSRGTNNVQGDIQNASVNTFMAINGPGYFIVQQPSGFPDGTPVFTGVDLFTRRGDFQLDKDGYLVNGTGYYLKVLRVDGTTGNVVGSVPEVLQFSNDFLPARPTTLVEYRANLATFPRTAESNIDVPGSERLNANGFGTNPTAAGTGTVVANDLPTFIAQSIAGGAITMYDSVGSPVNIQLRWAKLADVTVNVTGNVIPPDTVAFGQGNTIIGNDIPATGTSGVIPADIQATGLGNTSIAVDVAAAASTIAFDPNDFDAEVQSQIVMDTSTFNADMTDGESFTIEIDGDIYTFTREDTLPLTADDTVNHIYYFDGSTPATAASELSDKIEAILGNLGLDLVTSVYDGGANTITITAAGAGEGEDLVFGEGSTDFNDGLAGAVVTDTAYQAASTFTLDDGVNPLAAFTFVTGGGNAAAGTFSTVADLIAAINHANSGLNGSIEAEADGPDGLRLVGQTGPSVFTVGGDAQAILGFNAAQYTVANAAYNEDLSALAGQSFTVSVGGVDTVVNLTAASTRASILAALGPIAAFNGNNLELTAQNNDDIVTVSGGAAAAVGFGAGNNSFNPNGALAALDGMSVTFSFGNTDVTVDFGTGAGEVHTRDQLMAELGAFATLAGNNIVLTAANNADSISVSGAAPALAALGFGVGNNSFDPTNAAIGALNGQNLNFAFGSTNVAVTFGNNPGEVSTRAELMQQLGAFGSLSGLNQIQLTAGNNSQNIVVSGSAGALTALGFGGGNNEFEPGNLGLAGLAGSFLELQLGNGAPYTITFGANNGAGEVNNRAELAAALAAGAAATGLQLSLNNAGEVVVSSATDQPVQIGGTAAGLLGLQAGTFQGNLTPRWELFYLEDSNATGNQVAWRNVGTTYTFDAAGQMTSNTQLVTLNDVTINGVPLGELTINHGESGITQFSDVNGVAQVNLIRQNGYPAGNLQSIDVNEKGRIIATYSNGRTLEMAEIVLASFNADNSLKRLNGGAFEATSESGQAQYGAAGKIVGKSLEGSNTDIADEFTKLIVTQQAYAANTRIVTTSDTMLQETLNMVR